MIDWRDKAIAAVVSVAVCAGLMWYAAAETGLGIGAALLTGLMMSGLMWGMRLRIMDGTTEYKPVIAPFLERHLLKPVEKRRWEKWREEGREQARAKIRARLKQRGLNPDELLPPEENDGSE